MFFVFPAAALPCRVVLCLAPTLCACGVRSEVRRRVASRHSGCFPPEQMTSQTKICARRKLSETSKSARHSENKEHARAAALSSPLKLRSEFSFLPTLCFFCRGARCAALLKALSPLFTVSPAGFTHWSQPAAREKKWHRHWTRALFCASCARFENSYIDVKMFCQNLKIHFFPHTFGVCLTSHVPEFQNNIDTKYLLIYFINIPQQPPSGRWRYCTDTVLCEYHRGAPTPEAHPRSTGPPY